MASVGAFAAAVSVAVLVARRLIGRDNARVSVLSGRVDSYGGINVVLDAAVHGVNGVSVFAARVDTSLAEWRAAGRKGAWITVPAALSDCIRPLLERSFVYHHAEGDHAVLCAWLPGGESHLPTGCTHQVGVGAVCVNAANEILLVREATGPAARPGLWKIPTGLVDVGEELSDAVVREVKEEVGIDATFEKVLVARHGHGMLFGKSDLFFVCLVRPTRGASASDSAAEFALQRSEIAEAKWAAFDDFIAGTPYPAASPLWKRVYELCRNATSGRVGDVAGIQHERLEQGWRPGSSSIYHAVAE